MNICIYNMPKGTKLHCGNSQLVYVCGFKQTERVFETEQLYEMYRKRHAKICACKGIVEQETATVFVAGKEYLR